MQFKMIVWLFVSMAASTAAHAGWKQATSDNFVVYSEGGDKELRAFTAKVEAFDSLLRVVTRLEAPPAPKRLEIYLLRDAASIQSLLGRRGRDVAGLYEPAMAGAVALVPRVESESKFDLDGETVLFHEYAHHFMMQYYATAYPPWYVEGFAEFYSTAEVSSEKGTASIGKPAYHRAYGLTQSLPFPIERLLSDRPNYENGRDGDAYYGRAWLLTHMLNFMPARRNQLSTYLDAYASGISGDQAAVQAFGPIADLDKDLKSYLRASQMSYRSLSGLAIKAATIKIVSLGAAENALVRERLGLIVGMEEEKQKPVIQSVRKQTALFPESPYALNLLADTELWAGNDAAAIEANDRLLKLVPEHVPGLLRKAEIMARSTDEVGDEQAFWKIVRSMIIKANHIDVDNPVALYQYYASFRQQGIKPPTIAVTGLIRAHQLAPQSKEIRFRLAQQMMQDKDYAAARDALLPIAFNPHGESSKETALDMLSEIEAMQTKAAATDAKALVSDN